MVHMEIAWITWFVHKKPKRWIMVIYADIFDVENDLNWKSFIAVELTVALVALLTSSIRLSSPELAMYEPMTNQ